MEQLPICSFCSEHRHPLCPDRANSEAERTCGCDCNRQRPTEALPPIAAIEPAGANQGVVSAEVIFVALPSPKTPRSAEELERFKGLNADGTPKGLTRCLICGELYGECLPPLYPDKWHYGTSKVRCRCFVTRCRKCGDRVHDHEPISNYYDEKTRQIIHAPYFAAMGHQCKKSEEVE